MLVDMRKICKDFTMGKSQVHVLKDVDLTVEEGEFLAIMGPSGSGKSTLMNILGFLDVPTSGEYIFNGANMEKAGDNRLADVRNKETKESCS